MSAQIAIHSYQTSNQTAQEAGYFMTKRFEQRKNFPILFLVSGGSALEVLKYILLPKRNESMTLAVLDERFSLEHSINNFSQLRDLPFFDFFMMSGGSVIDTRMQKNDTLEIFSDRFEVALRRWRQDNPKGQVWITQGIGVDGHTAGILPFPEDPTLFKSLFEDSKHWVVGYDAGTKTQYPLRVTVTLPFLREHIDFSLVFASGSEKKTVLQKLLYSQDCLSVSPMGVLKEMKDVVLFTSSSL